MSNRWKGEDDMVMAVALVCRYNIWYSSRRPPLLMLLLLLQWRWLRNCTGRTWKHVTGDKYTITF
jgi:hypothetical protein